MKLELMDPFFAITDPNRRRIIEMLALHDQASSDLAAQLDVVAQTTSQHLKALLASGLVSVRRSGKQRIYSLELGPLGTVRAWLDGIGASSP